MSSIAPHARAAAAVVKRDFLMWSSYRTQVVTPVFVTLLTLTIFYYVSRLVSARSIGDSNDYYAFVVVGLVFLSVLTAAMSTLPLGLRQELVAGTFERLVLSPYGPVRSVLSMAIFPVTVALAVGVLSVGLATVIFGLDLQWPDAVLGVPVALLGALAFAPLGVLTAAAVLLVKQASSASAFLVSIMSVVAGVYFPVELLPGWIRWASEVQPLTPVADLMRHLLVGTPLQHDAWLSVAKLAGFALVLFPASLAALSAAVRVSSRRGTITEY